MQVHNLFSTNPGTNEEFTTLLTTHTCRLEKIVSHGQPSPPDFWYDQPNPEWVMLVQGTAILDFEDHEAVNLQAGDYLCIPANCKHRVEVVSDNAIWLALHFQP